MMFWDKIEYPNGDDTEEKKASKEKNAGPVFFINYSKFYRQIDSSAICFGLILPCEKRKNATEEYLSNYQNNRAPIFEPNNN